MCKFECYTWSNVCVLFLNRGRREKKISCDLTKYGLLTCSQNLIHILWEETKRWWWWEENGRSGLEERKNERKKNAYSVNLLCIVKSSFDVKLRTQDSCWVKSNANCLEIIILLHELYESDSKRSFKRTHFLRVSQFDQCMAFAKCTKDFASFRSIQFSYMLYVCCILQIVILYDDSA